MTVVGYWGDFQIPLFEKSDVSPPYFVAESDDGTRGFMKMVPMGEGDRPSFVVEDDTGTRWESSTSIRKIIDSFNDGNVDGWVIYDQDNPIYANATRAAAHDGEYGLDLDGVDGPAGFMRSVDLPHTPPKEGEWMFWWKPISTHYQFEVSWCINTPGNNFDEAYALSPTYDTTPDGKVHMEFEERYSGGSRYVDPPNGDSTGDDIFSYDHGEWLRTRVKGRSDDRFEVKTDTGEGTSLKQSYVTAPVTHDYSDNHNIAIYTSTKDHHHIDTIQRLP